MSQQISTSTGQNAKTPTRESVSDGVNRWLAEWRAELEQNHPNPLNRMRYLASHCSSEFYWQHQRERFIEWNKAKQEVSDFWRRVRERFENEHEKAGVLNERASRWQIHSQVQEDPELKRAEQDEKSAHELFWRATFEGGELYDLLVQFRPALLQDFGPSVRLDESYTPRERADWCNAVLAKLLAESSTDEPVAADVSLPKTAQHKFPTPPGRKLQQVLSSDEGRVAAPSPEEVDPTGGEDVSGSVMNVEQANQEAKRQAQKLGKGFFALSKRKQAELIGCHHLTWEKTEFYRMAVKQGKIKSAKMKTPKVVSFTSGIEAATGEGDKDEVEKRVEQQELARLIAEQKADKEVSPMEDDPPGRERKIHFHKRL